MPWVVHVLSLPSNGLEYAEKIPRVKDYHRCQDELREKEDINVGLTSRREKSPSTKFAFPHQIYASMLISLNFCYLFIYLFTFKDKKKNCYLWHLTVHDPQPEKTDDSIMHLLV